MQQQTNLDSDFFYININHIESFYGLGENEIQVTMASGKIIIGFCKIDDFVRKVACAAACLEAASFTNSTGPR
jgi:uncharacterized protein YlzI (FlbEa/FlbD family)